MKFTYGTIINESDDLSEDTEFTVCVFNVGIGKSFCHKVPENDDEKHDYEVPNRPGYDSVFLERASNLKALKMDYMIYNSENAVLTHVIKCQLEIKDLGKRSPNCKICKDEAIYHCENDNEYFCQKCDDIVHGHGAEPTETGEVKELLQTKIMSMMREKHTRVLIQNEKKSRFGQCKNHPKRSNEYYHKAKGAAYCSLCAIELEKKNKENETISVLLDQAYSVAK